MARSSELRIASFTDDDGIARIGLMRVLLADDTHTQEQRTKGGIWVALDDAQALASAARAARAFADSCDELAHKQALAKQAPKPAAKQAPKPAPKPAAPAAKAPAPKAPMCNADTHADNAKAGAKFCPLCGKDLTILVKPAARTAPAPAPKAPASPAPAKSVELSADDYARLIG